MWTAVLQPLPVPADPALVARNLVFRTNSADPVVIAERLGIDVMRVLPAYVMNAPGALRPNTILVSAATPAERVDRVVAELLGLAAIDLYAIPAEDRHAFSRDFADALGVSCCCQSIDESGSREASPPATLRGGAAR